MHESRIHIVLITLILLMSMATMGSVHEWAEDEPYYMIAAMHMDDGGSIIVPAYADGSPRFPKPILFYWLVLLSYKIMGVSLFASRLPAFLSAAAALFFTWRLSRQPGDRDSEAMGAVYILSSLYLFYFHGKVAITDMTMAAALTAGLCFLSEFVSGIGGQGRLYASAFAFGLAGLTKGPVAIALAFLTVAAAAAFWKGEGVAWPSPWQAILAFLIMIAVTGWWYIYMAVMFWPDFIRHQIGNEMASRMDGFFLVRFKNILWYLRRLAESGYPWTLLAAAALLLRALPKNRRFPRHTAWCGFGATLLFYGLLIDTKRTRYLVPALPFLAIILSDYLTAAFNNVRAGFFVSRLLKGLVVFMTALMIFLGGFLAVSARQDMSSVVYLKMGLYLLLAVVITAFMWSQLARLDHGFLMAAASALMVLNFTFATLVFQATLKNSPMAELAKATYRLPPGSKVGYSGIRRDLFSGTLYFFGNREVLVPGPGTQSLTHRVVDQRELDELGEKAAVVSESFSFSRGVSVDLMTSLRKGDLLARLPRDGYYLVRLVSQ